MSITRRQFLATTGLSIAAATIACARAVPTVDDLRKRDLIVHCHHG
jgi:hypothetical protein